MDVIFRAKPEAESNIPTDLLQTMIDSFPGGVTAFDGNLRLMMANDTFYQIYDLDKDEFPVGTHYSDIGRRLAERGYFGEGNVEEILAERLVELRNFKPYSGERFCPDGRTLEVRGYALKGGGFVTTI